MKLYICSDSINGTEDIDGIYYLFTEEGECLASHFCSNKRYALFDLIGDRPERIEKFTKRFGECECSYLGEDDMTFERLIELNSKLIESDEI